LALALLEPPIKSLRIRTNAAAHFKALARFVTQIEVRLLKLNQFFKRVKSL